MVKTSKKGITLHSPLLSRQGYYIEWKDIGKWHMPLDGPHPSWIAHLREKDWFNAILEAELRKAHAVWLKGNPDHK